MIELQPTSVFNVRATLNAAFNAAVAAFTTGNSWPEWFGPAPVVRLISGDDEPPLPAYSVAHFDVEAADVYQGRQGRGGGTTRNSAILEVSAWATRQHPNWTAQLAVMADLVQHWHNASATIRVRDFFDDPTDPAATTFLIRLAGARTVDVQPDPNPDIERRRILIDYWWHYSAHS